jgi:hypothetical protein
MGILGYRPQNIKNEEYAIIITVPKYKKLANRIPMVLSRKIMGKNA